MDFDEQLDNDFQDLISGKLSEFESDIAALGLLMSLNQLYVKTQVEALLL